MLDCLSGIERIPTELLRNIFRYCVDDDEGFPREKMFKRRRVPVTNDDQTGSREVILRRKIRPWSFATIALVCKRWRFVALDHPRLWATVTPNASDRIMEACIEHSQKMCLDCSLDLACRPRSLESLATLVSAIGRIQRLRFLTTRPRMPYLHKEGLSTSRLYTFVQDHLCSQGAPELKSLEIVVVEPEWDELGWAKGAEQKPMPLPVKLFAGRAPKLESICVELPFYIPSSSPLWSNPSSVCLHCFSWGQLANVLCKTPNLSTLRVDLGMVLDDDLVPAEAVSASSLPLLPNLFDIHFHRATFREVWTVLACTPNIERLTIQFAEDNETDGEDLPKIFLPQLKFVSLKNVEMQDLPVCLPPVPWLHATALSTLDLNFDLLDSVIPKGFLEWLRDAIRAGFSSDSMEFLSLDFSRDGVIDVIAKRPSRYHCNILREGDVQQVDYHLHLVIQFNLPKIDAPRESALVTILESLFFPSETIVQSLELISRPTAVSPWFQSYTSAISLRGLLLRFPNIKVLAVDIGDLYPLFDALHIVDCDTHYPVPLLQKIVFRSYVNNSARVSRLMNRHNTAGGPLRRLMDLLASRTITAHPLQYVAFTHPDIFGILELPTVEIANVRLSRSTYVPVDTGASVDIDDGDDEHAEDDEYAEDDGDAGDDGEAEDDGDDEDNGDVGDDRTAWEVVEHDGW
ncbi:uncharacterized protein STEHIDRAFT_160208 [Stereum hirsutum FP-91666 SS1]|uniref:uncharacterized protein n=1 Tax=Stereum hirsutum (strain FP-91666) TaxID=721885 RepID=UPI000444A0D7|nr:uncharacterized protein STEHIDRAFT_160208 [Stereum hirsutum FP-91666 SS1]EIM83633.1 hypothetical protein STEHIDRAFT_160208 [Stereum hirsutum FP-91666 SS1]